MSIETGSGIGAPTAARASISAAPSIAPSYSAETGRASISSPDMSGGMRMANLQNTLSSMPEIRATDISMTDRPVPGNLAFTRTVPLELPVVPKMNALSNVREAPVARSSDILTTTKPLVLADVQLLDRTVPGKFSFAGTEPLVVSRPEVAGINQDVLDPIVSNLQTVGEVKPASQVNTAVQENATGARVQQFIESYEQTYAPPQTQEATLAQVITPTETVDEETETEKRRKKKRIIDVEYVADATQALRVQNALELLGVSSVTAQEQAITQLHTAREKRVGLVSPMTEAQTATETQPVTEAVPAANSLEEANEQQATAVEVIPLVDEKKGVEEDTQKEKQKLQKSVVVENIIYEEDPAADKQRHELGLAALELAITEAKNSGEKKVTGADATRHMPDNPQPISVKSELLTQRHFDDDAFQDGSYSQVVQNIKASGEIFSPEHGEKIIDEAIKNAPAVRENNRVVTRKVTHEDVVRVLQGRINSFAKELSKAA